MTITSMVGLSVPHEPVFCGYVLLDCPLQSPGKVLADPHMTVVPQTHASFLEGLALYESRPDKEYSLTDCISMQTMRREGLTDVLTNDHHCRQEGFRILFP